MAVADGEENVIVHNNNPHQQGDDPDGDDTGPRNGSHPIPATDYFAGGLVPNNDLTNLTTQAVIGSIGQRVTSVTGTERMDMISQVTVLQAQFCLTNIPEREVCGGGSNETGYNVIMSTASAQPESQGCNDNSDIPVPLPLSVAPPLNMNSLTNTFEETTIGATGGSSLGRETTSEEFMSAGHSIPEKAKRSNDKVEIHHYGERSEGPEHQILSSGYYSDETVSQKITPSGNKTVNLPALQLSEAGINAIKRRSGTQTNPVHQSYATFPRRLQSFSEGFHLGDGVQVNKDLLSLAGFFYSGHSTVTCYHCDCSPREWGQGRDPENEHKVLSPYCKAIVSR